MGRPPIGTRAMTGAQRQRRYSAKRTRLAATPVATTTASVVELKQLKAQLEKMQRDTQDEVPLPGGIGVNVKCLLLYPGGLSRIPGSTRCRGPACNPGRRRSGARRSESPRNPSVVNRMLARWPKWALVSIGVQFSYMFRSTPPHGGRPAAFM
jgi:hypothetical protein